MRHIRPVLSALGCVAVLLLTLPPSASGSRRFYSLEKRANGRDTVRALGEGEAARFVQVGERMHALSAFGGDAPQRYIVTFDEPAGARATPRTTFATRVRDRRALADRFGSEIARRGAGRMDASGQALPRVLQGYDRLVAGAVVLAPPNSDAMLRAIPGVRAVFADLEVTANAGENLTQVRADRVQQELGGTGLGVRVGIIDTGIDYTHAALGGGFGPGYRVVGGWDFVNDDADPRDDHGHGTHVAGIAAGNGGGIVGMAPQASLYAFKVLDQNGSGWLSDIIAALERAADPDGDPNTDDALDAVNLSLGAFAAEDEDPSTEAVDALDALGTVVVIAAGNYGFDFGVGTPGIARSAITVGSVAAADTLSSFSSRGPTVGLRIKPDVLAPGESIASSWLENGNAWLSGTSMATPHVTGAAALLRQLHPDWTHEELRSALVATAKDLRLPAARQGSGRLDAFAAATASLFVSPTSLSFGRVRTDEPMWARAETLYVHSRAAGVTDVTLSLDAATLPSWLEATLSADHLLLDPGVTGEVILRLRTLQAHAPLEMPPYIAEGAVRLQANGRTSRIPFSIHEALKVRLTNAYNGNPTGILIGRGRAWPSLGFSSTWLIQPGLYDVLVFNDTYTREREPFLGITDAAISSDSVLTVTSSTARSELTWSLEDERGSSRTPRTTSLRLLYEGGGGLGFIGLQTPPAFTLPAMKPGYRLEWWALDDTGSERYDIPGVEHAPFTDHVVANDPAALRRLVEHVHVAAGDSLLLLEFPLYSDGDGWFGFAGLDPFVVPYGRSFDVVRWTAPVPASGHLRYGHTTWSMDPAKARKSLFTINGLSPVWDQRHGDTIMVVPRYSLGGPLARFTGRDLPFGSGAAFPDARFQAWGGMVDVSPQSYGSRLFRDAAGSIPASPAPSYEFRSGAAVLGSGTIDLEELRSSGRWRKAIPGPDPIDLVLRSNGWTVAGRPSTTTVTAHGIGSYCPSPEWFSIVAGGGPVERIAFGQHRDPHVEMRFGHITDDTPIAIEVRDKDQVAWTPLVVERHETSVRATIPPIYGDIAMRVRIGAVPNDYSPMTVEIEPAFVGVHSAAANAQVVQAQAGANGARIEWRVGAPGEVVVVERAAPNAAWQERGEVVVRPDGIARFEDPSVTPGSRYGYRLAGSNAAVFLDIPAAVAGLSFALRPNPSSEGLLAAVTLDRDAPVTIRVHDLQGRLVASQTWTGLGPGLHVLNVMPRGKVTAGLYFVRLEREGEKLDRRVTILE